MRIPSKPPPPYLTTRPGQDSWKPALRSIKFADGGLAIPTTPHIEAGIGRLGGALSRAGLSRAGLSRAGLSSAVPPLDDFCSTVVRLMTGDGPNEDDVALLVARTRTARSWRPS